MKTIEEEAKEFASKVAGVVVHGTVITYTIEELNSFSESDFKSGVEFAQRWIPVEEEAAPLGLLLMKLSNGEIRLGNFTSKVMSSSGIFIDITHWRQIELK